MFRLLIASVTSLLAVGCVAPQQRAANYSSPVLCYGVYAGNQTQQSLARAELAARGFTCTPADVAMGERQWAEMGSRDAAYRQRNLEGAAILLTPPPTAPRTTCTTRGNQTVCQ